MGVVTSAQLVSEAVSDIYHNQHVFRSPGGTGFAAEHANHSSDIFAGRNALLLSENRKDGADRIVNSVEIQSKYYPTAKQCIDACYRDGEFRYEGMQIEVPSDLYHECVLEMQRRIGPDAGKIIRKGSVTYSQARLIAQAGNIQSFRYDIQTGAIASVKPASFSAVVAYLRSLWNGASKEEAFTISVQSASYSLGSTVATNVVCAQISRTRFHSMVAGKYAPAVVQIGLSSIPDALSLLKGEISARQAAKNTAKRGSSVFWNVLSFVALAKCTGGTSMLAHGARFLGSWWIADKCDRVTCSVIDSLCADDAVQLEVTYFEAASLLATQFCLTENEMMALHEYIAAQDLAATYKAMYSSGDPFKYALDVLSEHFVFVVEHRKRFL